MARSRSSFEIAGAVAAAASLAGEGDERRRVFDGVALVSFGQAAPPAQGTASTRPRSVSPVADAPPSPAAPARPASDPPESVDARRPPKLPDLAGIASPIVRCQKIVEWIGEATGASDVFLADGSGLPVAGAVVDVEARLAGAGLVAASVAQLAASLPGSAAPLFELHLGDGPFFQLVGFEARGALYLVGLTRPTPLSPRQAHAVRLACRHALGDVVGGAA
ncbi:MAG TPA: hypothetical protein VHB21_03700 [Minicystis sp.]|nr:hypothetical protein [Minicystis sp.]